MIEGIDSNVYELATGSWDRDTIGNLSVVNDEGVMIHYKKKPTPKFPKVFEDNDYKFEIKTKTGIAIIDKQDMGYIFIGESLPLLKQALKYQEDNS